MIERILVPLDGSQMAESVLPVAVAVAKCISAQIILLHIIEDRPPRNVHGEPHLTSASESHEYLGKLVDRLRAEVAVDMHVHEAQEHDVALSVAAHAEELDIGMIVLSTHGRSGPKRVVWGSIAQQVLRRAQVPVLLARPDMKVPDKLESLLVSLDGSPGAEIALLMAVELACDCKAQIELVRVVPTSGTLAGDEAAVARLVPTAIEAALDEEALQATGYLAEIVERLARQGAGAKPQILRGDPVQVLSDEARKSNASLIVVATHGRSGLGALWIGSVGAGLMSSADRPLLLVRRPDGLSGDKD
jgi:nucleotide-binding universal stress UspA family protein